MSEEDKKAEEERIAEEKRKKEEERKQKIEAVKKNIGFVKDKVGGFFEGTAIGKFSSGAYENMKKTLQKKDISVKQYSQNGSLLREYEFIGAFPTTLGSIALDWATSSVEEFTCTWAYDRWNAQNSESKKIVGV